MGIYRSIVFPCLCDVFMRQAPLRKLREELLEQAVEPVLEIGIGSGLNLPHYPPSVGKITAVDPNPALTRRALKRSRLAGKEVELIQSGAEDLALPDNRFQTVVSTWTLCSVADPAGVMRQIYRVLAPGGRFLFVEHGLADNERVRTWQRRLNGLQMRLADGCRLTVDLEELIAREPFEGMSLRKFYLPHAPKTHGFMRMGAAFKVKA